MNWKTLQPTTSVQVAGVSHVLESMQRVIQKLEVCTLKGKKAITRLSSIGYWSKSSTVGWYFGIAQGS